MKILQIIYTLHSGGAERFVVDLCNELSSKGNEVYLCTLLDDNIKGFDFYKKDIVNDVNYINLKLSIGFKLSNIIFIYKLINKLKPDIVHCHLNLVNYIFPISLLKRRTKFFYTVHSLASTEVESKFEYLLRRFFFNKNIITAITISRDTTNSYIDFYKSKNCVEILNGRQLPVKSNDFNETSIWINKLRLKYEFIFVHIGRCSEVKNQTMLIKTINKLTDEGQKIGLLIIGNGFETKLGAELKMLAKNNIQFLGEKHYIADYLLNADAFCLSSVYEGMPITLIESLACGCVPICTPVGGIVDTIKNGITGFISSSIAEDDYYLVVKEYIKNSKQVKKETLISYYFDKFSMAECKKKHMQLYCKK